MTVLDQEIVKRLRETIDFLKVESVGGVWNTPQLINMLEDLLKDSKIKENDRKKVIFNEIITNSFKITSVIGHLIQVNWNSDTLKNQLTVLLEEHDRLVDKSAKL